MSCRSITSSSRGTAATRSRAAVAPALVFAVLITASSCSDSGDALPRPSAEFCELAYEYDQDIARIGPDDPVGHLEYLEPLLELAPDDISADLERLTDAMRRVRDGNRSVIDDPEVEDAGNRFYRRAVDGCRLHDQNPPGGF
jgi:hypothetical protein